MGRLVVKRLKKHFARDKITKFKKTRAGKWVGWRLFDDGTLKINYKYTL